MKPHTELEYLDAAQCPEPGLLWAYSSGELNETGTALLAEHLSRCDACTSEWKGLSDERDFGELLREARREMAPELRAKLVLASTTTIRSKPNSTNKRPPP